MVGPIRQQHTKHATKAQNFGSTPHVVVVAAWFFEWPLLVGSGELFVKFVLYRLHLPSARVGRALVQLFASDHDQEETSRRRLMDCWETIHCSSRRVQITPHGPMADRRS